MVDISQINLANLSMKDLEDLERRIEAAKQVPAGLKSVALASMLKSVLAEINKHDPQILGDAFAGITPQALPKEANIGKRFGLSETQTSNAREKGAKAVTDLG